ncbi:MAG: UbiA family prenyltransferase [Fidelibacterota bacterium]
MLIARLIKSDTDLYRRIRERIGLMDSVFLLRPSLMFPVWIMIVAGMGSARSQIIPELYWVKQVHWETVVFFVGLTLMAGSTFLRFQVKNHSADRLNRTVTALGNRDMNAADVRALALWLMAGGLALTAGVSIHGLVATGEWASSMSTLWAILTTLTWLVFHAGDRFQWFARPVLGVVTYILTGLFLFMVGWTYGSGPFGSGLVYAVPYVLLFVAISILTAVPDREGDRGAGKKTFALRFGVGATVALSTAFVGAAAVLGYLLNDPVISTGSTIALPFFLVALVFSRMDHVVRAIRYPVLILAIFVSVKYPWLFVALVVVYFGSKVYYYFRFNIDYPTFHVSQE